MKTDPRYRDYLQWLSIEKGRSPATIEAYQRDLADFCEWLDEQSVQFESVDDSTIERYIGVLRQSSKADSSIARSMSTLRGWFGFMVGEGEMTVDPTSTIKTTRRGRTLPKPLSEESVARLLDSIGSATATEKRARALLELLYGTGARVSEAIGIGLEDLDFDEGLILVTGKGSKQRLVPMGAALRVALLEYLGPGGRSELERSKKTSKLFLNTRGGPLSRQGVDLIIQNRALVAGVERSTVSAHVFRHSCATHMLAHGADIRVVQELLGHASISTTQIYTSVSVTSLKSEYLNAHPRAHG